MRLVALIGAAVLILAPIAIAWYSNQRVPELAVSGHIETPYVGFRTQFFEWEWEPSAASRPKPLVVTLSGWQIRTMRFSGHIGSAVVNDGTHILLTSASPDSHVDFSAGAASLKMTVNGAPADTTGIETEAGDNGSVSITFTFKGVSQGHLLLSERVRSKGVSSSKKPPMMFRNVPMKDVDLVSRDADLELEQGGTFVVSLPPKYVAQLSHKMYVSQLDFEGAAGHVLAGTRSVELTGVEKLDVFGDVKVSTIVVKRDRLVVEFSGKSKKVTLGDESILPTYLDRITSRPLWTIVFGLLIVAWTGVLKPLIGYILTGEWRG